MDIDGIKDRLRSLENRMGKKGYDFPYTRLAIESSPEKGITIHIYWLYSDDLIVRGNTFDEVFEVAEAFVDAMQDRPRF